MLMPDVNVLIYAHRSTERVHAPYREWLEQLVNGREPFALSVLVAVGFVRIVTHLRFSTEPTPVSQAWAQVEALTAHPNCRVLAPGDQHLALVSELCRKVGARGGTVADVDHAAIAIEHGCTWVTRDADFAAFARFGLRWTHLVLG